MTGSVVRWQRQVLGCTGGVGLAGQEVRYGHFVVAGQLVLFDSSERPRSSGPLDERFEDGCEALALDTGIYQVASRIGDNDG